MKQVHKASWIVSLLLLLSLLFTQVAFSNTVSGSSATGTPSAPSQASGPDLSAPVFLPLVVGRSADISGRVLDTFENPVAGVRIVSDSGESALTDSSGFYVMPGLYSGDHALAPSAEGYVFWPSVITARVPSSMSQYDFTAIAACTDIVVNGSFEDGVNPWEFPVTPYPAERVNHFAHSGAQSVRTGIVNSQDNTFSYSSIRQLVSIPDEISSAKLRLWLYSQSGEPITASPPPLPTGIQLEAAALSGDVQYVLVLDKDNNILETLLWMLEDEREWQQVEFDLNKYAGDKIKIHIGSYNDGVGGVTALYVDDVSLEVCPEGEPTSTPLPTITGTPPACENELENSGFESNRDWEIPNTVYDAGYATDLAHNGSRSMRTGIVKTADNIFSYSDAGQWVSIPKNSTSATLKLWAYPITEEATTTTRLSIPGPSLAADFRIASPANDVQYLLILNEFEEIIEIPLWQLSNEQSWVYHEFDLDKYSGRTIKIQFGTFNTGGGAGVTAMYVDDITLEVCPSGVPTATPTITPTPTQTLTPTITPLPSATPTATTTPIVSATPTASPTPSNCSEEIENGGFEKTEAWIIPITEFSAGYSDAKAHAGSRAMRTGIIYTAHNRFSYSDARQVVTIPASADEVKLSLWLYPLSEEADSLAVPAIPSATIFGTQYLSSDVQYVIILDRFGNWIDTLLWERSDDQAWTKHTFDLSAYAGETIKVQFGTFNDGLGGVTAMYVDDVSLQTCP